MLYNLIGYSVSGQTRIRSLIINPGLANYVFCIETQEHRRKKEREYIMVYTNMNILYWYELEMAVLPFTSINKKEFKLFQINIS